MALVLRVFNLSRVEYIVERSGDGVLLHHVGAEGGKSFLAVSLHLRRRVLLSSLLRGLFMFLQPCDELVSAEVQSNSKLADGTLLVSCAFAASALSTTGGF